MLRGYGVAQPISTVPTGLKLASFLTAVPRADRAALRKQLGAAAQTLAVDRFSEEEFARDALAVYEGCLARAAGASAA